MFYFDFVLTWNEIDELIVAGFVGNGGSTFCSSDIAESDVRLRNGTAGRVVNGANHRSVKALREARPSRKKPHTTECEFTRHIFPLGPKAAGYYTSDGQ